MLSLAVGRSDGLIFLAIRAVVRELLAPREGSFFAGASGRYFEVIIGPAISDFLCIITRFARPEPLRSESADFQRPRLWMITGPRALEERDERTVEPPSDGAVTDLRAVLVFR